jgi:hypothetical protein
VINYSSIVVIPAPKEAFVQKLIKVHKKETKGSKFKTTFEVIKRKIGCLLLSLKFSIHVGVILILNLCGKVLIHRFSF